MGEVLRVRTGARRHTLSNVTARTPSADAEANATYVVAFVVMFQLTSGALASSLPASTSVL